jgi:hypothetical protein
MRMRILFFCVFYVDFPQDGVRWHQADKMDRNSGVERRRLKLFGNVVQEQVSCCNLNTYTFGGDTYWSTLDQITRGDTGGRTTHQANHN